MIHLYRITNTVNTKVYIGQTTYENAEMRWATHKSFARKGSDGCPKLMRALRKHGIENFAFTVIGGAEDQQTADLLECLLIDTYDSLNNGYNTKHGGSNGKHSEITKAKMSATRKANPEICATRTGDKSTEDTKQKMSASQKAIGNKPPQRTKEELSATAKARNDAYRGKPRPWSTNKEKPIFVDGFLYPSVKKAAEVLDAEVTTLHRNVRHPATSKRKPKFKCEWLCSPSGPSSSATATH